MTAAERALREAWAHDRPAVLAALARRLHDLQRAEDAVQEAFAAAAARWPVDGVPDRPGAWLTTTARRKALDVLRRDRFTVVADPDPAAPAAPAVEMNRPADDVLALVLTCCHPALSAEAQIALTLRHVAGLSDAQIAARFLVPEPTLTKRLVRARAKIRDARITFELPDPAHLEDRLEEVRIVVYLIFTEGYLADGDRPAIVAELCDEAVWLARQLHRLVPGDAETTGLLALLLLQHARAAARQDGAGRLVPFEEQDRALWDGVLVDEAKALLASTVRPGGRPGPYQLQAAIALQHATAPSIGPDWATVAALYGILMRIAPSPVVAVNRAVALGRAVDARTGLDALRPLLADPRLRTYLPLAAARADLAERAGDPAAAEAWRAAAALAGPAQAAAVLRRAARAEAGTSASTSISIADAAVKAGRAATSCPS